MLKFKADKISGISGTLYALSVIAEVVGKCGHRCLYPFPFYGLTVDIKTGKTDEWIIDAEFTAITDRFLQDVRNQGLGFIEKIKDEIVHDAYSLEEEARSTLLKMSGFDNKELVIAYKKFIDSYIYSYSLGALTFLYEHIVSERLASSLAKRFADATEMSGILLKTKYKSFMIEAEEQLDQISHERNNDKKIKLAEEYIKNFFYIKASYGSAPNLTIDTVLSEVTSRERKKDQKIKTKPDNKWIDRKLTEDEKLMVELLKVSEVMRDQRKRTNLVGSYVMFRFLDEAVKRCACSAKLAQNIFWYEYGDLFTKPDELLKSVQNREYASVVHENTGKIHYFEEIVVEPRQAVDSSVIEIKGVPASPGKVRGLVCLVLGSEDFDNVKKGDILVAEMTRPDFVLVMKKAGAIVTDEGSLTSHAAVISRELGIPCIVGARSATQVLKNGDEVEVDADRGIVRKLEK